MAEVVHRLCGQRFGGATGFDWHLRYIDRHPWIECRNPADIGLIQRADGVWVRATPPVAGERG